MPRVLSNFMSIFFYSDLIILIKIGKWGSKLSVTAYKEKESSFHLLMHLVLLQSISVARALGLLKVISLGAMPVSGLNWKGQGCQLWWWADGGGPMPDFLQVTSKSEALRACTDPLHISRSVSFLSSSYTGLSAAGVINSGADLQAMEKDWKKREKEQTSEWERRDAIMRSPGGGCVL